MPSHRIALVSPNYFPTTCGVGDHSLRLAQELRRRGGSVSIFSRNPVEPHPEGLDVDARGLPGRNTSQIAAQALETLIRWDPHAVVLQYVPQMWGAGRFGSSAFPRLCAGLRARGIRVVAWVHELFLRWSLRPDIALGALTMRLHLRSLARSVDHLIVTTERRLVCAQRLARGAMSRDLACYIPVGSNAVPLMWAPREGRFDVGVFSTLDAGKNFEAVIDAFAIVSKTVPRARLLLIGDLGKQNTARHRALVQRIRHHSAADRIVVTGKLPLRSIAEAVARLDVFVFAAEDGAATRSGTLPLALGAGLPVVAVQGFETASIFRPDENVVFSRDLSSSAIAEAVLRIFGDCVLRERVSRGGRALYERELEWTVIGERIAPLVGLGLSSSAAG